MFCFTLFLHYLRTIILISNAMDFDVNNVIIEHGVEGLASDALIDYVVHVYVSAGQCSLKYHGEPMTLQAGSCMIVRVQRLISDVQPSADLKCTAIYITPSFIEQSTPRNNYGVRGSLMLFINPVMPLNEKEQLRCRRNFEEVAERLTEEHPFKNDVVSCACQGMFLDFFQFHKRLYPGEDVPFQNAKLMSDFFQMLFRGDYRQSREVSYYADVLCVTPKYLSEVCKKVSGHGANYWINRFTIIEIQRLLRNRTVPLVQIADDFNFSSQAYFSRFVQNYLGTSPSAYRE